MTYSNFSFAMNIQNNQFAVASSSSFAGNNVASALSFSSAPSFNDPLASLFSGGNSLDSLIGNPYDLGLSNYQPTSCIDNMFTLPNTQCSNNNFESSFNFPPTQGNQYNQSNQAQNPMQMMMQFFMMMMQMIMQMMGMNPEQMGQLFNNGNNGSYGNNGVNGTNGLNGANGTNGASGANGSNNSGYVGGSNQPNAPVNSQGLSSPTSGRVSSEFGMRTHPISGKRKMHSGIDIAAPAGSRVNSMKDGKVIFAGQKGGYGNMIIVDHGNGVTTRYAHLSSINVRQGDSVDAGQKIGGVGSTGNSTGNHLHFEVRENGNAVNPRKYINP